MVAERVEPEVERQLVAAVERHREVVAAVQEPGRPESGQHVAVKAVGRAVQLVVFALRHAADSGVPRERLVQLSGWDAQLIDDALSGWDAQLIDDALAQAPEPRLVAQLAPRGLGPAHVAEVAAGIEATARLQGLAQRILADIADDAWAPTPTDLIDLHERVDSSWRSWRQDIGRGH